MSDLLPENVRNVPCMLPPPGQISNFINPVDLANWGYAVAVTAMCLTTLIVTLRFLSRITVSKHCGRDDYVLFIGWMFFVALCAEIFAEIRFGIGRHLWDTPLGKVALLLKHLYVNAILWALANAITKIAVFLQLLRILNPINQRGHMFWICWISIILCSISYSALVLYSCLLCRPIAKFWIPWMPGTCGLRKAVPLISAVANVLFDLIIIILPQRTIWYLNMSINQKIKVSMIFLVGLVALGASVTRLYYSILIFKSDDNFWYVSKMGLWAVAEIAITTICSSVPSLHGLLRHWKPPIAAFGRRIASCVSDPAHKYASNLNQSDSSSDYQTTNSLKDVEQQQANMLPDTKHVFLTHIQC